MANSKRKHSSGQPDNARKRAKASTSGLRLSCDRRANESAVPVRNQHEDIDQDQVYSALDILDETATHYLIAWADDTNTGESFEPTWEPKHYANRSLVADWERNKNSPEGQRRDQAQSKNRHKRKKRRRQARRIVEDTPSTNPVQSQISVERWDSTGTLSVQPTVSEIGDSQSSDIGVATSEPPKRTLLVREASVQRELPANTLNVTVPGPPSSFVTGAYERFGSSFNSSRSPTHARPHTQTRALLRELGQPISRSSQLFGSNSSSLSSSEEGTTVLQEFSQNESDDQASQVVPDSQNLVEDPTRKSISPGVDSPRPDTFAQSSQTLHRKPPQTLQSQQSARSSDSHHSGSHYLEIETGDVDLASPPAQVLEDWQQNNEAEESTQSASDGDSVRLSALESRNPTGKTLGRGNQNRSERLRVYSHPLEPTAAVSSQPICLQEDSSALEQVGIQALVSAPIDQVSLNALNERPEDTNQRSLLSIAAEQGQRTKRPNRSSSKRQSQLPDLQSEAESGRTARTTSQSNPSVGHTVLEAEIEQPGSGSQTSGVPSLEDPAVHSGITGGNRKSHPQLCGDQHELIESQLPLHQSPRASLPPHTHPTSDPSFPFLTQIEQPQPEAVTPVHRQDTAPNKSGQSYSRPGHLTSRRSGDRLVENPDVSRPVSSSLPSIPNFSNLRSPGESAPPRPRTLPSSSQEMDKSPSGAPSSRDGTPKQGSQSQLRNKLRELNAKYAPERERLRPSVRPSAPALAPLSSSASTSMDFVSAVVPGPQQPISALPPNIVAEKTAVAPRDAQSSVPAPAASDRSPSAEPAVELEPEPTREDMNTSERLITLLPQPSVAGTQTYTERGSDLRVTSAPVPSFSPSYASSQSAHHHIISVPLIGHQRDSYYQQLVLNETLLQQLLNDPHPSDALIQRAQRFLLSLKHITLHPDLDDVDALTQATAGPKHQAQWDINCSAKFRFLKTFLDGAKPHNLQVSILTQCPNLVPIIETFLEGNDIFSRTSATYNTARESAERCLSVAVIGPQNTSDSSGDDDVLISLEPLDRIQSPWLDTLQRQTLLKRTPLLTLVTPRTVEHIEMSLSPDLRPLAHLKTVLNCIVKFKHSAGRLEGGEVPPEESAAASIGYICSGDKQADWPLPDLHSLNELDSQTQVILETSQVQPGEKRSLDAVEVEVSATEPTKRAKVAIAAADQGRSGSSDPQDLDVTHISDSLDQTTQSGPEPGSGGGTSHVISSLLKLKQLLHAAEESRDGYIKVVEDVQYRFEEERSNRLKVEAAYDETTKNRRDYENDIAELKKERNALNAKIAEGRKRHRESADLGPDDIKTLHLRVEDAEAKEAKAKSDLEKARKETDYVRSMFQDASSRAQELKAQNTELEARCGKAEQLAAGEQARARELTYSARAKAVERENRRMVIMIRNFERSMKFKDEEIARLKDNGRGRMGTRNSSVPRSPRMGSPMMGRGSRQASPAASDARLRSSGSHPLRNG